MLIYHHSVALIIGKMESPVKDKYYLIVAQMGEKKAFDKMCGYCRNPLNYYLDY